MVQNVLAKINSFIRKYLSNKVGVFLAIVFIVGLIFVVWIFLFKKSDSKTAQELATESLIKKVSQLITLPEGETPSIATVSDPEKLRNQPFFANAKAGDKVLIYTTSKKAILYNPTSNLIVEIAPLNINQK